MTASVREHTVPRRLGRLFAHRPNCPDAGGVRTPAEAKLLPTRLQSAPTLNEVRTTFFSFAYEGLPQILLPAQWFCDSLCPGVVTVCQIADDGSVDGSVFGCVPDAQEEIPTGIGAVEEEPVVPAHGPGGRGRLAGGRLLRGIVALLRDPDPVLRPERLVLLAPVEAVGAGPEQGAPGCGGVAAGAALRW